MDTMQLTVNGGDSLTANAGKITLGAAPSDQKKDPQRGMPYQS